MILQNRKKQGVRYLQNRYFLYSVIRIKSGKVHHFDFCRDVCVIAGLPAIRKVLCS